MKGWKNVSSYWRDERGKIYLVQSSQVLGTSYLVASGQLFSNEVLGTSIIVKVYCFALLCVVDYMRSLRVLRELVLEVERNEVPWTKAPRSETNERFFSAEEPGTSVEERIKDESVKDSASPKNQKGFNITIEKLTFALNRQ